MRLQRVQQLSLRQSVLFLLSPSHSHGPESEPEPESEPAPEHEHEHEHDTHPEPRSLQQAASTPEVAQQVQQEINRLKEQVLSINKNLQMELEKFTSTRSEHLRRIMSYACYAETQKAKKLAEFITMRQKDFPLADFIGTCELSEVEEAKKMPLQDDFDSIEELE